MFVCGLGLGDFWRCQFWRSQIGRWRSAAASAHQCGALGSAFVIQLNETNYAYEEISVIPCFDRDRCNVPELARGVSNRPRGNAGWRDHGRLVNGGAWRTRVGSQVFPSLDWF